MIMAALATATACAAVPFTYSGVASELLVYVVSWRSLGKQDEVVALAMAVCAMLGVAARSLDMFEMDEDEDEDTAEDATDEIDAACEKPHCTLKAMLFDETDCLTAAEHSSCSGN